MRIALRLAHEAASLGEVPVGAVIVRDGELIAAGGNGRELTRDPSAHAEIVVLRQAAARLESWRLVDCVLYVTLEPCAMCAGALVNSRVQRLVFGAYDPKAGYCGTLGNIVQDERLNHRLEVRGGVLAKECGDVLQSFFRSRRVKPQ